MPDQVKPHGRDCLTALLLTTAIRIQSDADLPPAAKEAIGYTEPYVAPEGVPPLPLNGTFGENGLYVVDGGRLCQRLQGRSPKPLCTYDAWIDEDVMVQHDDGRDPEHVYLVRGLAQTHAGPTWLEQIRVPAEEFSGGKWETKWGYDAFVYPGRTVREHLATAVRDRQVPRRVVEYTSPGWHQVGERLRFFHCRGAVGDATLRVVIPGGFDKFVLPTVPEHAAQGVRETLWALRNLSTLRVMAAVIGCVFRAPLCHWRNAPVTLYIVGTSGIGKSTLAGVAASFFGEFRNEENLFGWSSSPNALENLLYLMKDHLIPMDDIVADGDKQAMQEKINRVVRAQGNIAGRRRMTANLDDRNVRPPRGLPLLTGEVAPTVPSLIARTIMVELRDGDLLLKGGTDKPIDRAQAAGPLFRHAMAGYVEWLYSVHQHENIRAEIDRFIATLRAEIRTAYQDEVDEDDRDPHSRIPGNVAQAACGIHFFLRYAVDLNQITRAEADALRDASIEALMELAHDTSASAASHHTALEVMLLLQKLVQQGRVRFLKKGMAPSGEGAPMVGWADDTTLYIPRTGMGEAFKAARDTGNPILLTEDRIMRELLAKKVLDRGEGKHMAKHVRTIRGADPQRCYTLKRKALAGFMGGTFWLPGEGDTAPDDPDDDAPTGRRQPF